MPLTPEGGGEETNLPDNTEENHKSWEKDDREELPFLSIVSNKKSQHIFSSIYLYITH